MCKILQKPNKFYNIIIVILFSVTIANNCNKVNFHSIDQRFWGVWEAELEDMKLVIDIPQEEKEFVSVGIFLNDTEYNAELLFVEYIGKLIQFNWKDNKLKLQYNIFATFYFDEQNEQLEIYGVFERLAFGDKDSLNLNMTEVVTLRRVEGKNYIGNYP